MRRVLGVLLVLGCAGVSVLANVAPTARDLQVTTWERNAVTFPIVVEDVDIDPANANSDTMEFQVVEPPQAGGITTDFKGVLYERHAARLVMTYTPKRTFSGEDSFAIAATDGAGESVRFVVIIEVRPIGGAGSLAGDLEATLTFDETQTSSLLVSDDVAANIIYRILGFQLQGGIRLKQATSADEAFDDLSFSLRYPIGGIGSFVAELDFDPNSLTPLFEDGTLNLSAIFRGISASASLFTDGTQTNSRVTVGASGPLGTPSGATLSANATFSGCSPAFDGASAAISFFDLGVSCLNECDGISGSFSTAFDCSGFTSFSVSATGLGFPSAFPYVSHLAGSVAIAYTLQTEGKTLDLRLGLASFVAECFSFTTELVATTSGLPGLGGVTLRAFHFGLGFENGVILKSSSSLAPSDLSVNNSVTGHSDYWAKDALSGTFAACEGIDASWELAAYFARPGVGDPWLFGWGMLTFQVELHCRRTWEVWAVATVRSGEFGGKMWECLFGFKTHW